MTHYAISPTFAVLLRAGVARCMTGFSFIALGLFVA
jgi:hypothetical protein